MTNKGTPKVPFVTDKKNHGLPSNSDSQPESDG